MSEHRQIAVGFSDYSQFYGVVYQPAHREVTNAGRGGVRGADVKGSTTVGVQTGGSADGPRRGARPGARPEPGCPRLSPQAVRLQRAAGAGPGTAAARPDQPVPGDPDR